MAGSFDVVVIGGGPGGYVAALRSAQLGARTAIVEKDRMGGTCLVRGCIPTKALLQSSELYTMAKAGQPFGLVAEKIGFDWPTAQKRKTLVVDQLVKGVEGLLKAGGVASLNGAARLAGKGAVEVGGDKIQAKDIVIATGSAVARIPLPGAELTIDSDQILELKEVPRRLAVIGGGVVGMEFAAMFAALGSTVTVLEMLPQVLAMVDAELVNVYAKHLAGLGGEIHTDSKVSRVVKQNGDLQVQFSTGGEGGAVDADQVLLAVGRVPYTHGLDAEKAGVKLDRYRVVVDEHLHTDADGIWAIGRFRQGPGRPGIGQAVGRAHHRPARDRPDRRGDASRPERAHARTGRPHDPCPPHAPGVLDGGGPGRAGARYPHRQPPERRADPDVTQPPESGEADGGHGQ